MKRIRPSVTPVCVHPSDIILFILWVLIASIALMIVTDPYLRTELWREIQ